MIFTIEETRRMYLSHLAMERRWEFSFSSILEAVYDSWGTGYVLARSVGSIFFIFASI